MVIKKYTKKKVAEILVEENPLKVLIVFWHGLGDLLMFIPLFIRLRETFGDIYFDLCLKEDTGQRAFYPSAVDLLESEFDKNYDITFVLEFPMSENKNGITKPEYCCTEELGITPSYDLYRRERVDNKLVAVHLTGTCLPGNTNPDEKKVTQKQIWDAIVEVGFIPIDVHIEHNFHNGINIRQEHITRHCRDLPANIDYLYSLIDSCFAFVGIASGPFVVALAQKPESVIYLQKLHKAESYTKYPVKTIDINKKFNKSKFIQYLCEIHGGQDE